ncbi:MAG TPA: hypothetical protein VMU50_07125 [Polyangia bacterium]|nr:hypothetical protein [Polyangia bacterium]
MTEFYSRYANLYIGIGVAMLLLVFGINLAAPTASIGTGSSGIVMLVAGICFKRTPLLRLFPDRIEIRWGPFGARKIVPLGQILGVDTRNPSVAVLWTHGKKVKIPMFAFQPLERLAILNAVGAR